MNDPQYGDLLLASVYLSFALYYAFGWRLLSLMVRKFGWQFPSNDDPTSPLSRWLVVTVSLVAALWNAFRGFGFLHPSSAMRLGYIAFLLAMILAIVVADHRERRRSHAQRRREAKADEAD